MWCEIRPRSCDVVLVERRARVVAEDGTDLRLPLGRRCRAGSPTSIRKQPRADGGGRRRSGSTAATCCVLTSVRLHDRVADRDTRREGSRSTRRRGEVADRHAALLPHRRFARSRATIAPERSMPCDGRRRARASGRWRRARCRCRASSAAPLASRSSTSESTAGLRTAGSNISPGLGFVVARGDVLASKSLEARQTAEALARPSARRHELAVTRVDARSSPVREVALEQRAARAGSRRSRWIARFERPGAVRRIPAGLGERLLRRVGQLEREPALGEPLAQPRRAAARRSRRAARASSG